MMGIGIPISQSKRPRPIVFSSLGCPDERPLGSKVPPARENAMPPTAVGAIARATAVGGRLPEPRVCGLAFEGLIA